jgi:hypothetical protein
MKRLGVDIGFSITRDTTAIAFLDGDRLGVERVGSTWESRVAEIPRDFRPTVIALDGPLLPEGSDERVRRLCEIVFVHAPFHNRCKPGLSHWGLGLEPRRASARACAQFSSILPSSSLGNRNAVYRDNLIVEAFPNAFLGVLTPEAQLLSAPKLRRGRRFDWLYEQIATTGRLESVLSQNLNMPPKFWACMRADKDHERRAALICLLTAALAAQGTAAVIGDSKGGWFWLPPWSMWQPWAMQGLENVATKMALKGHFLDEFRCVQRDDRPRRWGDDRHRLQD